MPGQRAAHASVLAAALADTDVFAIRATGAWTLALQIEQGACFGFHLREEDKRGAVPGLFMGT